MRKIPKHLSCCCLAVLSTATMLGCEAVNEPASITIALTSTKASVHQGDTAQVTVILTRSGSVTGEASLTVTGSPIGVTAVVSNVRTSGAVTTGTVVITVLESAAPGIYSLTVTGAIPGVLESAATFTLSVTELPLTYTELTLSHPAFTIVKDANTRTSTVYIGRTNFTGAVTLSLEQPGERALPAGITAAFDPNPATGASSLLTVAVASTVAAGTYDLLLRGAPPSLFSRYAILTLTVAEAGSASYTLSASPSMLTVVEGGGAQTSTISISRIGGFTGSVALSVTSPVPGAGNGVTTATLDPASTTGNSSTLSVETNAGPGTYTLAITAKAAGLADQIITILVTVPP
jgi:hypothetical protein